jgi:hypothetical protein
VTAEEYESKVLAVEAWAREEISRLGLRPISICPKPDDTLYEIARLRSQVAQIEAAMRYTCECLSALLYGFEQRLAPNSYAASIRDRFMGDS